MLYLKLIFFLHLKHLCKTSLANRCHNILNKMTKYCQCVAI